MPIGGTALRAKGEMRGWGGDTEGRPKNCHLTHKPVHEGGQNFRATGWPVHRGDCFPLRGGGDG